MCGNDAKSLERLVGIYEDQLRVIIRGRVRPVPGGRLDPEDILQDVFVRAVKSIHTLQEKGVDEFAWLCRLTYSCIADAWRWVTCDKRDVGREMHLFDKSPNPFLPLDWMTGPSGVAALRESGQIIEQILNALPEQYREILSMRLIDDLKFKEIAALLGITEQNAAVRYHRALKRYQELGQQRLRESAVFSK